MNSNCRYVNNNYIATLEELHMLRNTSKLTSINDRDPYSTPDGEREKSTDRPELLPNIAYPDSQLFVFSQRAYSVDDLRGYKGLDTYNQFVSGWVTKIRITKIINICLDISKVSYLKSFKIW